MSPTADRPTPEPLLIGGLTTEQLVDAMPQLVAELSERLAGDAESLRTWAREWLHAWNSHDPDAVLALVTDDIVYTDPAMFGENIVGKNEFGEFLRMTWRAFPDIRFDIAETPYVAVAGNSIAVVWRTTGTFAGDMGGGPSPMGMAPTGRSFDTRGVDRYYFRDGLLCRWVTVFDLMDQARQVGMLPGPRTRSFRLVIRLQRLAAPLLRLLYRARR